MKKINKTNLEKITGGTMTHLGCFGLGMLIIGWSAGAGLFAGSIGECWNN